MKNKLNELLSFTFEDFLLIEGKTWQRAMQFFVAEHFIDGELYLQTTLISSSDDFIDLLKKNRSKIRSDWADIEQNVLVLIFTAKLEHNQYLTECLKSLSEIEFLAMIKQDPLLIEFITNDNWMRALKEARLNRLEQLKNIKTIIPPWIKYEDIDFHDGFWRQGLGQSYLEEWTVSIRKLEIQELNKYRKKYPEPNQYWVSIINQLLNIDIHKI